MKERWIVLFREMAIEKILDDELDLKYPRSCFLATIIEFRESLLFPVIFIFSKVLAKKKLMLKKIKKIINVNSLKNVIK